MLFAVLQLLYITPAIEKNDVMMNVHFEQAANHVTWGLEAIPILHSLACLLVFKKENCSMFGGFIFSYAK